MDDDIFEFEDEWDCEITIFDGAYMTCDTAEEETYEEIEIYKDFDIWFIIKTINNDDEIE